MASKKKAAKKKVARKAPAKAKKPGTGLERVSGGIDHVDDSGVVSCLCAGCDDAASWAERRTGDVGDPQVHSDDSRAFGGVAFAAVSRVTPQTSVHLAELRRNGMHR